jgi:hypothetical protein
MIHRDTELPAFDSPRTLRQTGRSACPRFVKTLLNLAEARVASQALGALIARSLEK